MSQADIDKLQIVIEAEDKDALHRISSLVLGLEKLKEATKGFHKIKAMENIASSTESANSQVGNLAKSLNEIVTANERLSETSRSIGQGYKEAAKDAKKYADSLNEATTSAGGTKQVKDIGMAMDSATQKARGLADVFGNIAYGAKSVGSFLSSAGTVGAAAFRRIQSTVHGVVSTLSRIGKVARDVASSFAKVGKSAMSIASMPFKPLISGLQGVMGKITGVWKTLLRLAKLRLFRGIIKSITAGLREGINNAYQWANVMGNQFASSMNQVATSAQYLKNSLGAMAMPIFNALAPVLDALIDKVVTLLNVINQLIAKLTGASGWVKAVKVPKAYAAGMADAAGSAEKLKEELITILGIDELNVMEGANDSGGGGGGGGGAGGGYADMFEESEFEDNVSKLADMIKEAWEKADFTEIGTLIGTKLNEALESIPWDKIKKTAEKIGKSIATLLNGIIEVDDLATNIGGAIAEAFNTGFKAVKGFVENFHWDSLGKFIGDGINGFMDKLDWNDIRTTAKKAGKGIADTINSAFETIDWDKVGYTLAQSMNTVFDFLYELGSTIRWKDIGSNLAKAFNSWARNFDWKKAGATVSTWATGLLDLFISAIEDTDWKKLGEDVGTFIRNINWGEIIKKAFILGTDAIIALAEFGTSLFDEIGKGLQEWSANITWGDVWDFIKGFFTITGNVLNGIGEFASSVLKAVDAALTGGTQEQYVLEVDARVNMENGGTNSIDPFGGQYQMDEFGNSIIPVRVKTSKEIWEEAFKGLTLDEVNSKINFSIGKVEETLRKFPIFKDIQADDFDIKVKVDFILGTVEEQLKKFPIFRSIYENKEERETVVVDATSNQSNPTSIVQSGVTKVTAIATKFQDEIPKSEKKVKGGTSEIAGVTYARQLKTPKIDSIGAISSALQSDKYKNAEVGATGKISDAEEGRSYRTPTLKALGNIIKADQGNYMPTVKGEWQITGETKNPPKSVLSAWDIGQMDPNNPPKSILSNWDIGGEGKNPPSSIFSEWNINNKNPQNPPESLRVPWDLNNKTPNNPPESLKVPWNLNNKNPQNPPTDLKVPWNLNNKNPQNPPTDLKVPWNLNNKNPQNPPSDLKVPWNLQSKNPQNPPSDLKVPWNLQNKNPQNPPSDLKVPWNLQNKNPNNPPADLKVPWNLQNKAPNNPPGDLKIPWNLQNKAPNNPPSTVKVPWDIANQGANNPPSSVLTAWKIASNLLGVPGSIVSGWNLNHAQPSGKPRVDTGWDLDYRQPINKPSVKANLNITGQVNTPTIYASLKATELRMAKGGVIDRGRWHSIPQYASGTLNAGSYFVAGEAGPELVGHVGGRTEVLNQSQLAATMAASMQEANSPQNALLREQNALLRELVAKQGTARAYVTAGDVVDGLQAMNRRDGRTVVPIGV